MRSFNGVSSAALLPGLLTTSLLATSLLAMGLLAGCVDQSDGSGGEARTEGARELSIPLEPETQPSLNLLTIDEIVDEGGGRATMKLRTQFAPMALGEEYPSSVDVALGGFYELGSCSDLDGEVEITEVTGGGDMIEASRNDAQSVRLQSQGRGAALVQVTGRFRPSDEQMSSQCWSTYEEFSEFYFELDVEVSARAVEGVQINWPLHCEDSSTPLFFTGDPVSDGAVSGVTIQAVDADGEAFWPINASTRRPVSLTLTAPQGAHLSLSEENGGLASVTLPDIEGVVEITPDRGSSHQLEVVEPSQVTSVQMNFELPGLSSRLIKLQSGQTYGEDEFGGIGDRIIPSLTGPAFIGDRQICSPVPTELFDLTSTTPQVCTIEERELKDYDFKFVSISGASIGKSAKLLTDGVCKLSMQAPALNDGEGLDAELEATFVNIDTLISMD